MKLRNKIIILIISLVAIPQFLVYLIAVSQTNKEITASATQQLTSLASTAERALALVHENFANIGKSIASRTKFRDALAEYLQDGSPHHIADMRRILRDAKEPFTDLVEIHVLREDNRPIITNREHELILDELTRHEKDIYYDTETKYVALRSIITRNDVALGKLILIFKPDLVSQLMQDYTGLGETGEILVARKNGFGDAEFFSRRRFEESGSALPVVTENAVQTPIIQALQKSEGVFLDGIDYRGEKVFAATRYIEEAELGLVVKMDQREFLVQAEAFKSVLLIIVGSLIFILFFIAIVLAKLITDPIEALIKVTAVISKKDFVLPAIPEELKTKDEIGDLTRAFYRMGRRVKNFYKKLDDKVEERTNDLRNALQRVEKEKRIAASLAEDLAKFKMAVENTSDQILITDPEGMVLYANQAVSEMTGRKIKEIVGKNIQEHWKTPHAKELHKAVWDAVREKKAPFNTQMKNRTKEGSLYDVQVDISPVVDDKKMLRYFVVLERDITKEKEIDRAKTEFVSLASHQLRTPLSAISWYTEMLLSGDGGKISKTQEDYLKEIYAGNKRMVALVNALLNVSRIEMGTFSVTPKEVQIKKILNETIKELQPKIKEKRLQVTKKVPAKFPVMQFDPDLVRIIFQNIITNAVKYTPPEGEITILLKKEGKKVRFEVTDTGYGIPKKQQGKIFTKLFRADNVKEKDTEGTGLGLYMIKSIIEHVGGSITFTSKKDKGTTFTVLLPVKGMNKKIGTKKIV